MDKEKIDFLTIYNSLDFLSSSIRLQYTNFLVRNLDEWKNKIRLTEICQRLKKDEPIEYIINLAEFSGNKFYVDKRCLIPRHETEEIVSKTFEFINRNPQEKLTIIDVGVGSGAILLSIAKSFLEGDNITFIGIDKSKDALDVAKINVKKLGIPKEKVKLIESDFRDFDFSKYENLIVLANLPYIPNSRKLQPSVINYEPQDALFGGEKGDELINDLKAILKNCAYLKLAVFEGDNGKISCYCYER